MRDGVEELGVRRCESARAMGLVSTSIGVVFRQPHGERGRPRLQCVWSFNREAVAQTSRSPEERRDQGRQRTSERNPGCARDPGLRDRTTSRFPNSRLDITMGTRTVKRYNRRDTPRNAAIVDLRRTPATLRGGMDGAAAGKTNGMCLSRGTSYPVGRRLFACDSRCLAEW